jgi:RNA polymerase sigma-70 factor (ECF subfamily)
LADLPATPSGEDPASEWLQGARAGSREALERLLAWCRPYLLQAAERQVGADLRAKAAPSDLVQSTLWEGARDFAQFRGETGQELLAWLGRILYHNLLEKRRRFRTGKRDLARESPLEEVETPVDAHPSAGTEAAARERDEQLQRALERLPEHYRQVLHWRNYNRLPFEEVGRRLGRSAEAARKLFSRAVECLQKMLESSDESS